MTTSIKVVSLAVLLVAGSYAIVSDDLEDSFESLKQAEAKKDVASIKLLAAKTCGLARGVMATPPPAAGTDKESWTQQFERARTIEVYTEYALYAAAIQSPPATTVDLLATLEKQNPKSTYLDEAYTRYFYALNQTGAAAKIPAVAEAAIKHFPDNEDLLTVLADSALAKKQNDRALAYSERLVNVLAKHPKPENISEADWQRKRTQEATRGYWIAGILRCEKNDFDKGNKYLRQALPALKDNKEMLGPALFYLGLANYQLGAMFQNKRQVIEAIEFSEQAAAIESPYSMQAWRNVQAMKRHAHQMR
jgi:tetratricopeptide (TPR) repeat protein